VNSLLGREHLPGLLLVTAIGGVAMVAGRVLWAWAGIPLSSVLIALLAGLALVPLAARRPRWQPGLKLACGALLKLGVILVGLRLSLAELTAIGAGALPQTGSDERALVTSEPACRPQSM
jgi:uncharacterized membrane protein YadS